MKRIMLVVLPIAAVAYARDIPTQSPKSPRIDCTMKTILSAVIPPRYLVCCWLVGPPPSGLTCVPDDPMEWENPGVRERAVRAIASQTPTRTHTQTPTRTPSVTPTPFTDASARECDGILGPGEECDATIGGGHNDHTKGVTVSIPLKECGLFDGPCACHALAVKLGTPYVSEPDATIPGFHCRIATPTAQKKGEP